MERRQDEYAISQGTHVNSAGETAINHCLDSINHTTIDTFLDTGT